MADPAKRAAALRALEHVEDGMVVGLGTGSTAALMVEALAERVRAGLRVTGVPTSAATEMQAAALGIPLATLEEVGRIDVTIDGADEIGPGLGLIKGGGGALLREKIVAASSDRMVVIADASKIVDTLGTFLLPVEVVRFGWRTTAQRIAEGRSVHGLEIAGRDIGLRLRDGAPLLTDEGNHILDLACRRIPDPGRADVALNAIPGVIETGLFVGLATIAIVGPPDGRTELLGASGSLSARPAPA